MASLKEHRAQISKIYSDPISPPARHFVIVEPKEGKTVVDWGTPALKAALDITECPRVYRERTEMQENTFKRMSAHGALDINDGRKKIVGPDTPPTP